MMPINFFISGLTLGFACYFFAVNNPVFVVINLVLCVVNLALGISGLK